MFFLRIRAFSEISRKSVLSRDSTKQSIPGVAWERVTGSNGSVSNYKRHVPLRLRSRRLCELITVAGLRSVAEHSEFSRKSRFSRK